MAVLFQYAVDEGPITLYEPWKRPIGETLDLIEWMMTHTMVFFNATFDQFQLVKMYTIFRLCPRDWIPLDHIDSIAAKEPEAQDGPCLKPANTLDLLLFSRKGPYQNLMARENVRIRKVPAALAYSLAQELEKRVELDGIFFAKSKDKEAPRWRVYDIKKKDGTLDQHFKDVVLVFNPAGGLKFLAEHALGMKPKAHFKDIEVDTSLRPVELGYAPTALKVSSLDKNWEVYDEEGEVIGYAWPGVIRHHIEHWATHERGREYAYDDIIYTRGLDKHFGYPEPGDDDSVLACMVAAVRWRGFRIDLDAIRKLLVAAEAVIARSPINVNKPAEVRRYICECMDDTEKVFIAESTKKAKLTAVSNWQMGDGYDDEEDDEQVVSEWAVEEGVCSKCHGEGCARCEGTGQTHAGEHPAAKRAAEILAVKTAVKERELYEKLLLAGKLHADLNVIGALSSRMSGGGGLNVQGIKHDKKVRAAFPLAWPGYVLSGGDFDSFEVTIMDAVYHDATLKRILCSGEKVHAHFAMCMYPNMNYEQVLASEGTTFDAYTKGKSGFFGLCYFGTWYTMVKNFGIPKDVAQAAEERFFEMCPDLRSGRQRILDMFCSMQQHDGREIVWNEPCEKIESLCGFPRFFTLENKIAKALYDLAKNPPKAWRACDIKVVRRDRVQTAWGAVTSALFGAAFAIQNAVARAAGNHEIQSTGARATKKLQRRIWDIQPVGIHEFLVLVLNIHDELQCVNKPEVTDRIAEIVVDVVEGFRSYIPLVGMTWFKRLQNWAGKKGGNAEGEVRVRSPEMK
jgi:hypothetical protein